MRKIPAILAAVAAVAALGACGSGAAQSTPRVSTSAPSRSATSAPAGDVKALAAARKIISGYGGDPGDVATITPARLLHMVVQECAERALTGHGLDVARWRREGLLAGGKVPPIPCQPMGAGNAFNDIPKS